jgi:hypothetical protein
VVSIICLRSEIHINNAWLISSDGHPSHPSSTPKKEVLPCHSLEHRVVQGLHGHPVGDSLMKRASLTQPGKIRSTTLWGWARDGDKRSEVSQVLTTGPGAPLGPCRPCIEKGLMNLDLGLTWACSHLLGAFPGTHFHALTLPGIYHHALMACPSHVA